MSQYTAILHKLKQNTSFRNGALFSLFSFLNNGISFLLLIVIAKFVSPEGYGELNLFNTSVVLLNFIIALNSSGVISVNFFRMETLEVKRTINAVFLLALSGLLLLSAMAYLLATPIQSATNLPFAYQWLAIWICFFQIFTNVNLDIWRLEEKPLQYGIYSTASVLLNALLTILFIVGCGEGWVGRVYAQALTGGLFFLLSLYFLIKRGYLTRCKPTRTTFKDVLSFGVPLIPHTASSWIRQGLDRYIINIYQNTTLLGLFSFSFNFANIIQIIGTAFNATNSVFIYKNLAQGGEEVKHVLRRQTKVMVLFFTIISLFICIGAALFVPLLFPQYSHSIQFLIPQSIGALFQCLYLLFVNYLFYYKKTKALMYITFFLSVTHALLAFWLTRYSIIYTAYIGMFSNILIAVLVFLYSRKIYKII